MSRELKWLGRHASPVLSLLIVNLVCMIVGSALSLLDPLVVRWLIDVALPKRDLRLVLFGTLLPQDGQSMLVNWSVNADRTYQGFICADADGEHDADANIDIAVDRDKLDSGGDFDQPGFWTDGWVSSVDPQDIKGKLDGQDNHLHAELVMFGRAARCSEPDQFDNPPLVPGWQEMDGNSVLINGRPLNGLALDPIAGLDSVPTRVVALNDRALSGFTLRVTGTLVLDLNFDEAPKDHWNKYGLVTNHGTSEHIMNQYNVFKMMHDFTRPGGVMPK